MPKIEVKSISIDSPARKLYSALNEQIWDAKKYIVGKVLTIIDASISDKEQRKALKDIIEQAIYDNPFKACDIKDIISQFCERYSPELKSKTEIEFWDSRYYQDSQNYFPN